MGPKDTFILTEGFEVFHFFGPTPCENSLDAEFKSALQKIRQSHSIVFILPQFTVVVTSLVHQCVPGLFLTCSPLHLPTLPWTSGTCTHDSVSVWISAIAVP